MLRRVERNKISYCVKEETAGDHGSPACPKIEIGDRGVKIYFEHGFCTSLILFFTQYEHEHEQACEEHAQEKDEVSERAQASAV